jgi:hypothetical protein
MLTRYRITGEIIVNCAKDFDVHGDIMEKGDFEQAGRIQF